MKKCMVCFEVVEAEEPTCPRCGEASWGVAAEVVDPVADTQPAEDPADITTADASPRAKRGRRGA